MVDSSNIIVKPKYYTLFEISAKSFLHPSKQTPFETTILNRHCSWGISKCSVGPTDGTRSPRTNALTAMPMVCLCQ